MLPWFEFGPVGEAWRAAVGTGGWVIAGFDWRSWLDTAERRRAAALLASR